MSIRGFIRRALGREPKWQFPTGNGLEHDDWRIGDLAECMVKGDWHRLDTGQPVDGPRYGQILRVTHVGVVNGWHGLIFEGVKDSWCAECFLKIRPRQREACTDEFARLIKRLGGRVDA